MIVAFLLCLIITSQISLLILAAWGDLASRIISDYVCLAIGFAGAIGQLIAGPTHLVESLLIAAILFFLLLLLHSRGVLGGGDVKLLVAVSVGLPPFGVIALFTVTALAGGVLAVVHLGMRRLPRPMLAPAEAWVVRRVYAVERWRIMRRFPMPYGVAVACGGIWAVLTTIHIGG